MSNQPMIEQKQIAQKAFEMWESQGRPTGKAEEHWRLAEQQLRTTDGAKAAGTQQTSPRQGEQQKQPQSQQHAYASSGASGQQRNSRQGK